MENVKTIFQKVVAVLTVFILLMTQYVITGLIETTYAIDLLATQSNNVQFRAYFMNGEEEVTEIEKEINAKDLKLRINVAVKNEGYFNGQISLENAGFKFISVTNNTYVDRLENNIIYLNQINSEETAQIEVGIKYLEEESISVSTLSSPTTVKLIGTYKSSNPDVEINSGSDVKVTWKIPQGTKAELASELKTNFIYKIGNENKKIVQYRILSNLTKNAYPIKTTEIVATIPDGATKKEVHKWTTNSTNGDKEFTEAENVVFDGNSLKITVNNTEEDGKINWKKSSQETYQDIYIVTYEYPENTNLSSSSVTVNERITTQNNVELIADQVQIGLNDPKEGIATVKKQEREGNIYKGKIYAGQGREITSYTTAYVDYAESIKGIEITEEEAKYGKEVEENGNTTIEEIDANVEIKRIIINKERVATVLGTTWNMTIGETTINNEREADENGNIIIPIPEGTKTVIIRTSKPVNNGSFIIETVKEIKNTEHTREEKKELTKLIDSSSIKCTKNDDYTFKYKGSFYIGLKETESKASIQCSQKSLAESNESQQLDLTITLESNGESQDLYKNPVIRIKLPSEIKTAEVVNNDVNIIYGNGLSKNTLNTTEENNQKVIEIKLQGEQTSYLGEAIQGTQVSLKINTTLNDITEDITKDIVMNFTNENATKYVNNGEERVKIEFIARDETTEPANPTDSSNPIEPTNPTDSSNPTEPTNPTETSDATLENDLDLSIKAHVGKDEINEGDTVRAGEIITYTIKIKNIGNSKINDLNVLAEIPAKTKLVEVNEKFNEYDETTGSYKENGNYFVTKDTERLNFPISLEAGEEYSKEYRVEVNEDTATTEEIISRVTVSKNNNEIKSTTNRYNITNSNLKVISMPIARDNNTAVAETYGYMYKIAVLNLTDEVQNNVQLTINKNDILEIENLYINSEEVDKDNLTLNIGSIEAKGEKNINLFARVGKNNGNYQFVEFSAIAKDSSQNTYRSNLVLEEIEWSSVTLDLTSNVNTNTKLKVNDQITYTITVKNNGASKIENLMVKDIISNYLKIEKVTINNRDVNYTKKTVIEDGKSNGEITIETDLSENEEKVINILAKVDYNLPDDKELKVNNKAFVYNNNLLLNQSNEIIHLINYEKNNDSGNEQSGGNQQGENQQGENQQGENQQGENQQGGNQSGGSNDNNGKEQGNTNNLKTISGIAWFDTNKNGKRDTEEKGIRDIKVILYDLSANNIASTSTLENGQYSFYDVEKGKYVVVFDYDKNSYDLTTYRVKGVKSSVNSDAQIVKMKIDNTKQQVASTDTIEVNGKNITNIDIGLTEPLTYDLSLTKTITKVTVTNKQGTRTIKYNNTKLAKLEIKPKFIKGSVVLIEYSIKVTNEGESTGYVKNIVDYKPKDMKFNSGLNKSWYEKDNYLYSNALSNTKIKPGETKEIKLILTKTMTDSNTGLTNNTAEIKKDYNLNGRNDKDSTPGNKEKNEDDIGNCDIIITVGTGLAISYIIITLLITIVIGICAFVIIKKLLKNEVNI